MRKEKSILIWCYFFVLLPCQGNWWGVQEINYTFSWYLAINLYDEKGNRKPKWINTELEIRGNKKNAQEMLDTELEKYNNLKYVHSDFLKERDSKLFCDYTKEWLVQQKNRVDANSYCSDAITVNVHLFPYFQEKNYLVKDIDSDIINQYFEDKRNGYGSRKELADTSLQRHHATISSILKRAIKEGYIKRESVDDIKKPKNDTKQVRWYTCSQIQKLIDTLKATDSKLLIPVILASYYSLRREEVVGLREEDIDFENHMLYIEHIVVTGYMYNSADDTYRTTHMRKNEMKNETSRRAFPIFEELENCLKNTIERNRMYQQIYGNTCNKENIGYINVHENGNLITPDYITHTFCRFIKANDFPKITFHGLRHSSASLLLQLGYTMKEAQLWLGHSDYTTTAKTYAHVASEFKVNMANTLSKRLIV